MLVPNFLSHRGIDFLELTTLVIQNQGKNRKI